MKTVTLPVNKIKMNKELLALRGLCKHTVSKYTQALKEGAEFPLITVDQNNNVIKGHHRLAMYRNVYEETDKIKVYKKIYKNKAEILKDFTSDNIKHGLPFSSFQKKLIQERLIKEKFTAKEISKLLGINVKAVIRIDGHCIAVTGKNGKTNFKPTKFGMDIPEGKSITEAVYEEHKTKDKGVSVKGQCSQLTRWIENDLINRDNESNMKALYVLYTVLEDYLD